MEILFTLVLLFILLGLIVCACIIFTNAIEHLGCTLNLSQGAIGSVLAAVGTALPETLVPIVAIIGGYIAGTSHEQASEIGIGAILGAPFLLGTLAFCITGIAVYYYSAKGKRTKDMPVNTSVMKRDMKYFLIVYFIAVASSFIPHLLNNITFPLPEFYIKVIVAILLVLLYGRYVYLTIKDNSSVDVSDNELEPLYVKKFLGDGIGASIFQVVISIVAIIILAHFFVECIKEISEHFHIPALILSLIIAPIATELPEKFNSILWVRSNKDTLALGNITGAMVFQSSIPPVVGLLLTPWVLNLDGLLSVGLVYISLILVYINILINKNVLKPWILVICGLFYVIYLAYIIYQII